MVETALSWFPVITLVTLLISAFVFAPLGLFHSTRSFAANALIASSYLVGMMLWVIASFYAFSFFSWWGVLIGIALLGIGVIPVALLGLAMASEWTEVLMLLCVLTAGYGFRLLGVWYLSRSPSE